MSTVRLTFIAALRDRLLNAVLGVALLLILVVPAFSLFSMRQVQELAVTLTLSAVSFVLLVLAVLMGSSSIWRDVERRYTASVVTLPISRYSYVLGKFCGISLFLVVTGLLLGCAGSIVVVISASRYPSDMPVHWLNFGLAIAADVLKYILLTAVAMLFSALSSSLFLPMFGSIAVFLAGSGSQQVFEYVTGPAGGKFSPTAAALVKGAYYFLPNFAAFNLKVQAIYGLPQAWSGLLLTLLYFAVYTLMALLGCMALFARRQLS
jgi:ABC-type transport system involved in multi-copper enzyme maturation permease subunit